jgi:hypothetical protein
VAGNDRRDNYNTVPGPNANHNTASALRTDFVSGSNATFRVDVPNGTYSIRLYHSNPLYFGSVPYNTNPFTVTVQGTPYTVPVINPGTTYIKELSGVSVGGGTLTFLFGAGFMIAGIDISAGGLPADMPLAASGVPLDDGGAAIGLQDLQPVVAEATARWSDMGLTPTQTAALASVQFAVADLGGTYLGLANPATNVIRIDDDAAMIGWSMSGGQSSSGNSFLNPHPRTLNPGVDLLTVVMHELGHLLGYEHSDDDHDLMAPVLSAGLGKHDGLATKYEGHSDSSFVLQPTSLALRPSRSSDDVFSNLGRDGLTAQDDSTVGRLELVASQDQDLLAASSVLADEESTKTRVPRRSRMQRFERDLDAWFAELATEESGQ